MQKNYKYKAFISYSHKDEKIGKWLHKALEKYKIPTGLEENYPNLPKKLYPIFRDREELSTSSDLTKEILQALKNSHYLIVLCSPFSAQSFWVNQEIIDFKTMYGEDRVLAMILDGEPHDNVKECFPKALKYKVINGEVTKIRTEPIAADIREGKDGKKFGLLKIIAGILEVEFEELYQREEKRQRRNRWIQRIVTFIIFSIMTLMLLYSINQRDKAIKEKNRANNYREKSEIIIDETLYRLRDTLIAKGVGLETLKSTQDSVGKYYEEIESEDINPETLHRIMAFHSNSGDIFRNIGDLNKTKEEYEKAFSMAKDLSLKEENNIYWQRDLFLLYNKLGKFYYEIRDWVQAKKNYERGLIIAKKISLKDGNRAERKRDISISYERLGDVFLSLKDLNKAEDNYLQALLTAKELNKTYKFDIGFQRDLSVSYNKLGDFYLKTKMLNKVKINYRKALEIRQKLNKRDKDNVEWQRDLSVSYNKLGYYYGAIGDLNQSEVEYKKALTIRKKLSSKDENNSEWQRDLLISHENIANIYKAKKHYNLALGEYMFCVSIGEKFLSLYPKNYKWKYTMYISYSKVASVYLKLNNQYNSEKFMLKATEIKPNKDSHTFTILANYYMNKKNIKKAERYYTEALKLDKKNGVSFIHLYALKLENNLEMNQTFEKNYIKNFKDTKESFIIYEMLKIIKNIINNQEIDIVIWKNKYTNIYLNWDFTEFNSWIKTLEDTSMKKNLIEVLDIFKTHNSQIKSS